MKRYAALTAVLLVLAMFVSACSSKSSSDTSKEPGKPDPAAPKLIGEIKIDGSSTVAPITMAVAEEFKKAQPGVKVSVGVSGTSGGFKKWVKGETDINDASRVIKEAEKTEAKTAGIEPVEYAVAYDGLTVAVSTQNTWAKCLTSAQLKKIWDKGSTVKSWKEVDASFPDEPLKLYGPGTDSGTFEYFTEHINGVARQSRSDYTASEDDNTLVQGVGGNKGGLGYFGYAYYAENKSKLKALAVDGGKGCVEPNDQTISTLSYPISRLIYIYPSSKAMERPEVKEFVKFYLQNASTLVKQAGYTPLPKIKYDEALATIK